MRRSISTVLALLASSCVREATPLVIDLEIKKGDLIVFARVDATTADPVIKEVGHTIVEEEELEQAITAYKNDALMIFVVHAEDFIRDSGQISEIDRRDLDVRLVTTPSDAELCYLGCDSAKDECEKACGSDVGCKTVCRDSLPECRDNCSGEAGNCGRCLVPSTNPPQIVNDGDSCELPVFAEGRFYRPTENGFEKSNAATDLQALDEAHEKLRLDWVQPCACASGDSVQGFDNLVIKPISPPESPWPLEQFAENSRGVIAGVRDRVAITFDRVNPPQVTEFPDLQAETRSMVALRNGDFLVASEEFIERTADGYRFDIFPVVNNRIQEPRQIAQSLLARPSVMKHLGRTPNAPLFLIGGRPETTQSEAAMYACSEEPFSCTAVPINQCGGETGGLLIRDAVMLENGVGVAFGGRAIYLKAPGPASPDPTASDSWTCNEFPRRNFTNTKGESIMLEGLRNIGAVENRVFLCAQRVAPPCEYSYPVVLSATVAADAQMPEWKIVAEGDLGTECREMLPHPTDDSRVRALMSNSKLLELTGTGTVASADNIGRLFTRETPGWHEILALESGNLIAKTRYNGSYVSDGVGNFEKLIGPSEIHEGHYTTTVPLPQGGFLAFGTWNEITRIEPTGSPGDPPAAALSYIRDMTLFPRSDVIRDAVLDTGSTTPAQTVILAVGYSDRDQKRYPLIRRFYLDPDARMIVDIDDIMVPEDFLGLSVEGVAESGPDRFVAYTHGSRLLVIDKVSALEVPLDWDAVDTTDVETRPNLQPNQCPPGNIPRLDAFRDIDARGGVAWAVGAYGLIVRIVGDRAERFMPHVTTAENKVDNAPNADVRTVRATCPDRVLAGGLFEHPNDDTGRTLRAWKVVPKNSPVNECIPHGMSFLGGSEEGNALEVRELSDNSENLCLNFASRDLLFQTPAALIPDGEDAVLVLENGLIQRLAPGRMPEARLKVPFFVLSAFEDGKGHVLFGGYESRLSIASQVSER